MRVEGREGRGDARPGQHQGDREGPRGSRREGDQGVRQAAVAHSSATSRRLGSARRRGCARRRARPPGSPPPTPPAAGPTRAGWPCSSADAATAISMAPNEAPMHATVPSRVSRAGLARAPATTCARRRSASSAATTGAARTRPVPADQQQPRTPAGRRPARPRRRPPPPAPAGPSDERELHAGRLEGVDGVAALGRHDVGPQRARAPADRRVDHAGERGERGQHGTGVSSGASAITTSGTELDDRGGHQHGTAGRAGPPGGP